MPDNKIYTRTEVRLLFILAFITCSGVQLLQNMKFRRLFANKGGQKAHKKPNKGIRNEEAKGIG